MKAVILAAGEGARLRPLTSTKPKHMIRIAGKPLLEHLLLAVKGSGIDQIVLIVGHGREVIQEYFGGGEELGISLIYKNQERLAGTANAIDVAREFIDEEYFLVVYGDLYIDSSLIESLIQRHLKSGLAAMTVVPVKNPQQFGVVSLRNELVEDIVEKPITGENLGNLANAGMYVFPKEIFKDISNTSVSSRAEFEITDTIRLLIKRGIPITASIVDPNSWLDLGRPWDLLEANERALNNTELKVKGIVEAGVRIIGRVGIEDRAIVRSGAYIQGPTLIEMGSDIGPNCYIRPFTSIGRNAHIGNACEVKNSVISDGTQIGHLSYIGDSIIGEKCNLGAGTITANLRFDDKPVKVMVKSTLTDSGRRKLGTIMGDNVKTGIGTRIMPGVKLGPNAWIGPGVIVYRDVEEGEFIVQEQTQNRLKMGKGGTDPF